MPLLTLRGLLFFRLAAWLPLVSPLRWEQVGCERPILANQPVASGIHAQLCADP